MSLDREIDDCPVCKGKVTCVDVSHDEGDPEGSSRAHARPCGHRVSPTVWPTRLQLDPYVEPKGCAHVDHELGRCIRLEHTGPHRYDAAVHPPRLVIPGMEGLPGDVVEQVNAIAGVLSQAVGDALIGGVGFIQVTRGGASGFTVSRLEPKAVIVATTEEGK